MKPRQAGMQAEIGNAHNVAVPQGGADAVHLLTRYVEQAPVARRGSGLRENTGRRGQRGPGGECAGKGSGEELAAVHHVVLAGKG
ncbi:hypothetical protein GCM10011411_18490 [Aurantiacibacter arachoides]|nr:hypothetical protein GCM10011411_18490 [Aurantiacibacter arachoides]